MDGLNRSFKEPNAFRDEQAYHLFPMRITKLDAGRYVVSGMAGDYAVISKDDVLALVRHRLDKESKLYSDLVARHLVFDSSSGVGQELLATKYRTKQSRLPSFTALHLFVVTLRCEHSCRYCQVSRVSEDRESFDMSEDTASRAIDHMLRSPAEFLKVEFQGGEALLNFPLVRYIVEETKSRGKEREVAFVITSNLANLTDEMLDFCAEHEIAFSTSLDGPEELHNANRPRPGQDSYQRAVEGIRRVRSKMGPDSISALMTSTAQSLSQPEAIIDEYVRQGFTSIFLRHISPYGFAVRTSQRIGYETDEFIEFFKRGLAYIIRLNREGVQIRESYTQLLLQRILTPFPTGYVDLQSPAGIAISAIVYNYDGTVYASDEGRMLAEMGDTTFCLGHVRDRYEDLFLESRLLPMVYDSMTEGIPGCCDCAFQPYCGSDPVFHHRTQGDFVGHRPTSSFCRRNMELIRHVIRILEDDPVAARLLQHWL